MVGCGERLPAERDLDDRPHPPDGASVIEPVGAVDDLGCCSHCQDVDLFLWDCTGRQRFDDADHGGIVRPHAAVDEAEAVKVMRRKERGGRRGSESDVDEPLAAVTPEIRVVGCPKEVHVVGRLVEGRNCQPDSAVGQCPIAELAHERTAQRSRVVRSAEPPQSPPARRREDLPALIQVEVDNVLGAQPRPQTESDQTAG